MNVQDYLKQKLETRGHYELTSEDKKLLDTQGIEEYIFRKLMSKKFRKYSVNSEYQKHIRSAIELNVRNDEPIKITIIFGGYK